MLNVSLNINTGDLRAIEVGGTHTFLQHGSDKFFPERISFK
jgi:hypothetical protein